MENRNGWKRLKQEALEHLHWLCSHVLEALALIAFGILTLWAAQGLHTLLLHHTTLVLLIDIAKWALVVSALAAFVVRAVKRQWRS